MHRRWRMQTSNRPPGRGRASHIDRRHARDIDRRYTRDLGTLHFGRSQPAGIVPDRPWRRSVKQAFPAARRFLGGPIERLLLPKALFLGRLSIKRHVLDQLQPQADRPHRLEIRLGG